MSVVLFDLAVRVRARELGVPVPRLLHNPAPPRAVRVAVMARLRGRGCRVWALGPDGGVETGSGAEGLAALARAAEVAGGDLRGGPSALIEGPATLRVLGTLAAAHADPARCRNMAVAAGSSLVGWWVERAAHPGTSAVVDLVAVSRQRMMLGTVPGSDDAPMWREALGVPDGLAGLPAWCRAVTAGPTLPGLEQTREDDDWLLGVHQDALSKRRGWDVPESLYVAAVRLQSRCDAAELYEAALLGDPLWRARAVHTGHVCHGVAVTGVKDAAGRVIMRSRRLDTRLKAGVPLLGWPGEPDERKAARHGAFHRRSGGDCGQRRRAGGQYRRVAANRVQAWRWGNVDGDSCPAEPGYHPVGPHGACTPVQAAVFVAVSGVDAGPVAPRCAVGGAHRRRRRRTRHPGVLRCGPCQSR